MKDFVFGEYLLKSNNSSGNYVLSSIDDSLQIHLKQINRKIKSDVCKLDKLKKQTIKSMYYLNSEIPEKWKVKHDYRNLIYDIINSDENFNKYIFENNQSKQIKERSLSPIYSGKQNITPSKKLIKSNSMYFIDQDSPKRIINSSEENQVKSKTHSYQSQKEETENFLKSFRDEDLNKHIENQIQKQSGSMAKRYSKKIILQKRYSSVLKGIKLKSMASINLNKDKEQKIINNSKDPLLVRETLHKFTKKNRNIRKNKFILPDLSLNASNSEIKSSLLNHTNQVEDKIVPDIPNRVLSLSKNTSNQKYGPFLHSNNSTRNYNIKNNKLKKLLNEVDCNGPYFSHCRSCLIRNMDFFTSLDEKEAINILELIKGLRKIDHSKIIKKINND